MKIGIYSLPHNANYGGILQSYALQTILERRGHEVRIIEETRKDFVPFTRWFISYPWRFYLKYVRKRKTSVFFEYHYNHRLPIITRNIAPFVSNHIHYHYVNKMKDLRPDDYDALVVGSDQVWRPMYYQGGYRSIKNAYLQFAQGWKIKRIAYGVSFGTNYWEYNTSLTKVCRQLVKAFDMVTVREDSAIELCEKNLGIHTNQVLDPTLLLNCEDYIRLIKQSTTSESPGDMLVYVLDETEETNRLCQKIASEKGMKAFVANSKAEDDFYPNINDCIQPSVEQWLRGFWEAKLIVTDSFHGCVFAILFEKPFYVISNRNRGLARIVSLLKLFGVDSSQIVIMGNMTSIPAIPIRIEDKLIDSWRERSLELLWSCLKM